MDEVHRFNKAQQDAFLPFVERGLLTFIGATTENPSFEVNGALLSRARSMCCSRCPTRTLKRCYSAPCSSRRCRDAISEKAIELVIGYADGDARRLLNMVEQIDIAAGAAQRYARSMMRLVTDALTRSRRSASTRAAISSTIRSRRCTSRSAVSRPMPAFTGCAACSMEVLIRFTWAGGIVRMASEDIGLADPRALRITLDACEIYERLGSPEGELALGEAALYLAMAPKSNAAYNAYNATRALITSDKSRPVPQHLRNAPTRLMKDLGYGTRLPVRSRRGGRVCGRRKLFSGRNDAACALRADRSRARSKDQGPACRVACAGRADAEEMSVVTAWLYGVNRLHASASFQSARMLASLMTRAHFAVSDFMKAPNSSGELPTGSEP